LINNITDQPQIKYNSATLHEQVHLDSCNNHETWEWLCIKRGFWLGTCSWMFSSGLMVSRAGRSLLVGNSPILVWTLTLCHTC